MANVPILSDASGPPVPSDEQYALDYGVAPQYIITLRVSGDKNVNGGAPFSVSTSVDESFSLSMASQWNAPYANVLQDALRGVKGGGAIEKLSELTGLAARTRATSAQVWQSSDPIGFSIPFTFIAVRNAEREIKERCRNLLKLVAPSEEGLFGMSMVLKAPGPTIANQLMGGRRISLHIGTFLSLYNCIVDRVDIQFDNIMGASGTPHKAKVTIDVKSYFTCFTTKDIDALFDKRDRDSEGG